MEAKATKALIYKLDYQISDMNRHYYEQHSVTLARHSDESDLFVMTRIIAFALCAQENLRYSKGLFESAEPTLEVKGYSDEYLLWIDLECPDEKRVKRACNAAEKVLIITATEESEKWWSGLQNRVTHQKNLSVVSIPVSQIEALIPLLERSMQIQVTIEGTQAWITIGDTMSEITFSLLYGELPQ